MFTNDNINSSAIISKWFADLYDISLGDILQILFISVMGVVIKYISELKEYNSSRARLGLKKPKKGWCPVQPGSGVRSRRNWKQRR